MTAESNVLGMKIIASRTKWVVPTLVFSVLSLLASPNAPLGGFWGGQAEGAAPTGIMRVLFVILAMIQSIAFGFGISFLLFGFPRARTKVQAYRAWTQAAHLAIAWSLISWWPHSSLHQTLRAGDLSGLLAIEYGFHGTLILAGLILAGFFLAMLRKESMP